MGNKKEVLLENGERALVEIINDIKGIEFEKFIKVNDEVVLGLMKTSPNHAPTVMFWLSGEYIGGTIVKKPQSGGCGGKGGGCGGGGCGGKSGGGRIGHC